MSPTAGQSDSANNPNHLRGVLDDVKLIATGGMSLIFRARQPALDRFLVVKKLKDDLVSNPETMERFRREAKALASVLHQNVAHVYDFVETPRESYLLMEYIDGIDLSSVIEKVGHLPPEVAAAVCLGVCRGLAYIHAHNLIHRDIKPSNIRLTNRGEVKLMDFGIVLELDRESLTRPGMMVGSPSYLSPEQVLGDSITPHADIFLVGISMYEMLSGTRPFKEENGETVFARIREGKYVALRKMQSNIPPALDRIVHRCLKKQPGKRFDSIRAMIADLEKYLGPEASSHPEEIILAFLDGEALVNAAIPLSVGLSEPGKTSRGVWIQWAVAAVLLALCFVGGFWMGKQEVISSVLPQNTSPVKGLGGDVKRAPKSLHR